RYWDGSQWTENVSDAGVASTDPYDAAAPDGPGSTEPTVVTPVGDTTDSYPTATPPASPPYVPPSPVADGGGDGGSKRGLVLGGANLAAVAIAVIAILALGGDDDDPSVRAELASAIQDDTDLTQSEAECVADLLVDEAGEDAFEDTDFSADDPPTEFIAAFLAVGPQTFVDDCGVDESTFSGSTDSTDDGDEDLEDLEDACAEGDFSACDDLYFASDLGSELEEFGSTCGGIAEPQDGLCELTNGGEDEATDGLPDGFADGSFEDMLTDTYQEMFGISEEKARCLAEQISGAVQDGELNEDQITSEIFDYLEECDISLDEISAN
ncbi:MAG: hypothetical protein ABWZ52_09270, partial [Acidimicrobiales bacterium]